MDNQEDITDFQTAVQRAVPVHDRRRRRRHRPRRASRRRCREDHVRRRHDRRPGSSARSTTRTCTSGSATTSSEAAFNLTFWKEGWATLGEYLNTARTAANAAGGLGTPAGDAAFEASLVNRFKHELRHDERSFWTSAPSNPTVGNLFSTSSTYTRPGTAYLALLADPRHSDTMIAAMKQIQTHVRRRRDHGAAARGRLPSVAAGTRARRATRSSTQFFTQWFDTAYPSGAGPNKPQMTGPGLNGPGFPCAQVTPASPSGPNGWYTGNVSLLWSGFRRRRPPRRRRRPAASTRRSRPTAGTASPCSVTITTTATSAVTSDSGPVSETFNIDTTPPVTTATLTPGIHNGWYAKPEADADGQRRHGLRRHRRSVPGRRDLRRTPRRSRSTAAPSSAYNPPETFTTGNHSSSTARPMSPATSRRRS